MTDSRTTTFGFWLYLMSDCLLFAALFATYAVLQGNTNGGPGAHDLFSLPYVFAETLILLTSSFTMGMAVITATRGSINEGKAWPSGLERPQAVSPWLLATILLGLAFLGLEVHEFSALAAVGHGPSQSGFLSSYFVLVGTHGLHVAAGVLWMLLFCAHLWRRGLTDANVRRLTLMSLFWHFLDLIWIAIFTIVYLLGII